MFPLLHTCFHCHGRELSMEFEYVLIISLTFTAVLVGRDLLTISKSLKRPAPPPLDTIRFHSPFWAFQFCHANQQIRQGQYPALFAWRKKLCRMTAALTIFCVESTVLWIGLMKILQHTDKIPKAFSITTFPWETIIEYYLLLWFSLARVGMQQPRL